MEAIKLAISKARRSVEATTPEANTESTFQAMVHLFGLIDMTQEARESFEKELRNELEEGLKVRKEPTH